MLLFEIWLAKIQAGNLRSSTSMFFVGGFLWGRGFFFSEEENLKKDYFFLNDETSVCFFVFFLPVCRTLFFYLCKITLDLKHCNF